MMIIDEMDTDDRCRFRRCSKTCNNEAKASKHFIYRLQFIAQCRKQLTILIAHSNFKTDLNFRFENNKGAKSISCTNICNDPWWRDELDVSTDLPKKAAEYFKKLLKEHQSRVKFLCIEGELFSTKLKGYDFGIEKLTNLETLIIDGNLDASLYLSKLKRPLNEFTILGKKCDSSLADCEQIYRVRDDLYMPDTKFTNEQFLRLSASSVSIHIGYLTELDIFNFIRSWQNGTIGKEIKCYEWMNLEDSSFDISKLLSLLDDKFIDNSEWGILEIKNNKEAEKIADLRYNYKFNIRFEVMETPT